MKLRYINTTFKVNAKHKVVQAHSSFVIIGGPKPISVSTEGIARAATEEFDEKKGKQLARARAEKKAYFIYRDVLKKCLKEIRLLDSELVGNLNKVEGYIIHQKEYIKSF